MYLTEKDIPLFPQGVIFSKTLVIDHKLNKQYPINEVSYHILCQVDNRTSIKEIAGEISNIYDISNNQALDDVKTFIFDLCKAHLMNMKHNSYMENLNFFIVYLITFKFKMAMEALTIRRRYDFPVGTNNIFFAFFFIILNILLVFKYNLLILFIMLTFVPSWGWQEASYMTLAFLLSIVVHECSHMGMLYLTKEAEKIGFLGRSYGTIGIHRNYTSPRKEIAISLIGPLVPFLIGVHACIVGIMLENFLQVIASFFWISHIISFFSDDGKNLKKAIQDTIKERIEVL